MCQRENPTKKMQRLSLQIGKTDLNYKLPVLVSEYVFIWIIFCCF